MLIFDRKSKPWLIGSVLILVVCSLAFAVLEFEHLHQSQRVPREPRGGTIPGLFFGGLGSALIIIAMALNWRKRVRSRRIGRARQWLQAHIWFGALSYPIILLHAWNHWGGALTQVLMWLFTLVIVSGIVGLFFQQFIPDTLTRSVPGETVYDQINHVIASLRDEGAILVGAESLGPSGGTKPGETLLMDESALQPAGGGAATLVMEDAGELADGRALLLKFYQQEISPWLTPHPSMGLRLAKGYRSDAEFQLVRSQIPLGLYPVLDDLRGIVEERRGLRTQRRWHRTLHWWLLCHVPMSYAMFVLAIIHAVQAVRWTTLGGW